MKKTEKQRVEEFAKTFHNKNVNLRYVLGAFGDMKECVGIVEEEKFPEEGGSFIKYLGCSYWQKGCPLGVIPMELIECYGLAKKILFRFSTDIIKEKEIACFLFFLWLFRRNKFYELLNRYVDDIWGRTIGALKFNEKRYNKFPKEVRRALKETFKKEIGFEMDNLGEVNILKDKKLRFYVPLYRLMELFIFLIDFDTAYKLPAQDILSELNQENEPMEELLRLINLAVERTQPGAGTENKLKLLRKSAKILKYFPIARRLISYFFQELNIEEIKMDEADWYFCLRRRLHNFRGVPLEERLEQLKKIDKEKGHVRVKFNIAFSEEDFQRKLGIKKVDNNLENN